MSVQSNNQLLSQNWVQVQPKSLIPSDSSHSMGDHLVPLQNTYEWSDQPFLNLQYLMNYGFNAKPLPEPLYANFIQYKEQFPTKKYTCLTLSALSARLSTGLVVGITPLMTSNTIVAAVTVGLWATAVNYIARGIEKKETLYKHQIEKKKEVLRNEVAELYQEMGKVLIEQYRNSPNQLESKKTQCFVISEALIGEKLELIKDDLIHLNVYDCFDEPEKEVLKLLKPLREAANVICKLYNSTIRDEHEGKIDSRFSGNNMFEYYLALDESKIIPVSTSSSPINHTMSREFILPNQININLIQPIDT